jgi:hypothetical protein
MTSTGLTDLLELSARGTLYPPTSRYHDVDTTTLERGGRTIVYLRRRFVPPPDRFALLREHVVAEGERPDTLAARYLGDAEQSWRLCDANAVMRPAELTERVGRIVRITLPEGIPGGTGG